MYTIDFDAERMMITIVVIGLWSAPTTATFIATLLARGMTWRLRHGQFAVLIDARQAAVQSSATIDMLEAMMPKALKITSAPIAQVVGSRLNKLQSERYLTAKNCRTFLDMDEAIAWIATERKA